MITNYPEKVKKNHQGSFLLSPAHGLGGARTTIKNTIAPRPAKKLGKVQAGGQKEKGVWGK